MRRPQIDVAETACRRVHVFQKSLDLPVSPGGPLDQRAVVNHFSRRHVHGRNPAQIQVIIGDIRTDLELRYTLAVQGDFHESGGVMGVDLNILGVQSAFFQGVQDLAAGGIIADAGQKANGPPHLLDMECKVEGGSSYALIVRKPIDQYFSNNYYHT
jgi:hypothetical protein